MSISKTPYTSYTITKGHYIYEYNLYGNNMLEIVYHNKRTHYKKIFHVYFKDNIDLKIIEESIKLADKMYDKIDIGVVKPNIPIYALIYVLNNTIPGFSYKCKIKRQYCPIKVYKYEEGRELMVNTSSLMEQMYRILKRFKP